MVSDINADEFLTKNNVYLKYVFPVNCSIVDKDKGLVIGFDNWNFLEFSEVNDNATKDHHIAYSRDKFTKDIKIKSDGKLGFKIEDHSRYISGYLFEGTTFRAYFASGDNAEDTTDMFSFMIFSSSRSLKKSYFLAGSYTKNKKRYIEELLDSIEIIE